MLLNSTAGQKAWLFRLSVLGSWLLFTLMVISISWAVNVMQGRTVALERLVLHHLGWLLWGGVTFVVMHLVRRFPIGRKNLLGGILCHVGLGMAVALFDVGLEYVFNYVVDLLR